KAALIAGDIAAVADYSVILPEQKYGERSRIDFLLRGPGLRDLFLEVKCVTLSREIGLGEFPDSVTARGAKHLGELARVAQAGHRAAVLSLVQRTDCRRVVLAPDIDPAYGAASEAARQAGVEFYCYDTRI